ncbi:ThuA domain-containing protein [Caldicellulosiruptor naganoensis]|uniref:ThuA domain-containing protein n=1 Tax=Caldicellulosiruptor naganoensis TaxID=29324 RepID=A0ABY7BFI5_9FIRM|nr:ThuA domain-containing protein [Caldicellulosiruptor naganoensis]WAM31364.1 ThuA domain-containing protein [Caldicellulosiruptor naganoensis]
MKKVLALVGDYYHGHDNLLNALKNALADISKNYEVIDSRVEDFESFLDQKPDAIVIAKENRINPQDPEIKHWMTGRIEKKIKDYVESGGRLFVWHSGLASYPENGLFCTLIKGYFKYHPDKQKPVRYHSAGKPIFNNKEVDFSILDEHYFVYCDKQNTNVYLYSESEDGKSIAGWWHKAGDGKVITLTPAHREDGLSDENFKNLLKTVLEQLLKE